MNHLQTYVEAWRHSAAATIALCTELTPAQWAAPTDCPGWSVQDVVAHNAHMEHALADGDDDDASSLTGAVSADYTKAGVEARRGRSAAELLDELRAAAGRRADDLRILPDDPQAIPDITPGNIGWSWDTLLRNRAIDMWVHEQDIRRAVERPGNMDSPGAQVATMAFGFGMPFVLGKKVKAAPGTSFVWRVSGGAPLEIAAAVGADGRASKLDTSPEEPSAAVSMSTEAFTVLAAGRRRPDAFVIKIDGDYTLADAVLAQMSVTP